jgi:PAS domain S-box-containing protein
LRYTFALLIGVVAVLLRLALTPYLVGAQFITFFPAVVLSAYLFGLRPGLLVALLCGVAGWYLFVEPVYSFEVQNVSDIGTLTTYFATAAAIAILVGWGRDAVAHERAAQDALLSEQDRTRRALDSISEGFVLLDRNFRVVQINAEGLRLEKRPASQILGRTHWEVWPGSEETELGRLYKRAMAERVPVRLEHRYEWTPGHAAWLDMRAYPTEDGLAIFYRDITDQKQSNEALRESEATLRNVVEQMPIGVIIVRVPSGEILIYNRASEFLMGHPVLGATVAEYGTYGALHEDGTPFSAQEYPVARAALHNETVRDQEIRYRRGDGHITCLSVSATPVRGLNGIPHLAVCTFTDVSLRKRHEEHQRLLINELNHRVKNTLATVQSIASQTLRNAGSAEGAREALENRLLALSRVHDVLTRENWEGADLYEIVADAVAPYSNPGEDRLHLSGETIRLPPRMALALAMALQELATNAVKYGALSNDTGEVRITWRDGDDSLHLTWAEQGGPPVTAPSRRGFGTRLIERSLASDLNGDVRIAFVPSGLVCTVDAPLTRPAATPLN